MDNWKRNGNTLYNDDEVGYENAKKRIQRQREKKLKEIEDRKNIEELQEIKRKVDIMWEYFSKLKNNNDIS